MELDLQLFGGRGASSSSKKIEVGNIYKTKSGMTLRITSRLKNGEYEFYEAGNRGIASEEIMRNVLKEGEYKLYTFKN